MQRDPLPVRERTRRAVRGELAQLAVDLFVEKGYDETTIDDLAAAAGMSKRTLFRYFASKEELVMGKYEVLGEQLAEDLAARPAGEPIWVSLRQVFGRVVEYSESEARGTASVAMEKIVRDHPALNASYLERVSRIQELVLDEGAPAPAGPIRPTRAPRPSSVRPSPASSPPGPPGSPPTRHSRSASYSTRQWTPSNPPDPRGWHSSREVYWSRCWVCSSVVNDRAT